MVKKLFSVLTLVSCGILFSACDSSNSSESKGNDTAIVAQPTVVNSNTAKAVLPPTKIEFTESVYDFGKIDEGQKVEHVFTFKNTGDNPLVLQDARASCGCTIPEYTKDTIQPGAEGKLNVIYDSNNKSGQIEKSVTVTANTEPPTTDIKIRVFVNKKIDGPFSNQ